MTYEEMMHIVIWTDSASPREQLLMLRIISAYKNGNGTFNATYSDIAQETGMHRSVVIKTMRGLKELGWIESEWNYEKNGKNLPTIRDCKYTITVGKEPSAVPSTEG